MWELTIALILEALIIFALLGAFSWYVRESNRDKTKLINGILAKNSQEYVERTLAENTEIKPEIGNNVPSEFVDMSTLDEEGFDKHIQQTLGNEITDEEVV